MHAGAQPRHGWGQPGQKLAQHAGLGCAAPLRIVSRAEPSYETLTHGRNPSAGCVRVSDLSKTA